VAYRNDGSDYYFPPGRSLARRVHGERAVGLLCGQWALLKRERGGARMPQLGASA
jgi:hypothetical protein